MEKRPVEPVFDEFVRAFGGERVSNLISQKNPASNADYFFRKQNILAELKCLTKDSFGPEYHRKMEKLTDDWMRRRLLFVIGTVNLDIRKLPPRCRDEWLKVIEEPLKTKVIVKANEQIRTTKETLDVPEAKGLLFLASDGNHSLQPYDILYFVNRAFRKKKPDGDLQFSSLHGICYFSLNMPVKLPGVEAPAIFWCGGPRNASDLEMRTFCDELERSWYEHQCKSAGINIPRLEAPGSILKKLKFEPEK